MKIKVLSLILLAAFSVSSIGFSETIDASLLNHNSGIAIKGYDPVSYHIDKSQKGSRRITLEHGGLTYWFSTEENKSEFIANPDKYVPAYGGWCAFAMLDNKQVEIDPERYKVIDGTTYLFYDGFWGNTLKKMECSY